MPQLVRWMNLTIESGFIARTLVEGNSVYGLGRWSIPVVKSKNIIKERALIDLNLQFKSNYYTYEKAFGYSLTYGVQFNFSTAGLMINYTQGYGSLNPSFYKYTDKDPLLSALLFVGF